MRWGGKGAEQMLAQLFEANRELMLTTTDEDVAVSTVEIVHDILELQLAGVWLHDQQQNALTPTAWTDEGDRLFESIPAFEPGDSLSWQVFESGTFKVVVDIQDQADAYNPHSPIRSELILPLGDFGVMNIGSTTVDAFDDTDIRLARLVVANAETAFQRVQREQDLQRYNERLHEFTSLVSHDLRNPLNVALGHVGLLRDEYDDDRLDTVKQAVIRIETLLDDMLALAHDDTLLSERTTVPLADLTEEAWTMVDTADASLTVTSGGAIYVDRSRLCQALENLFHNAIEHGGDDVSVSIGMLPNGFYVEDDGSGIPASAHETMFTRGYSTTSQGTGIGLSLVRRIIETHGAEIIATASDSGGARFEITNLDTCDADNI